MSYDSEQLERLISRTLDGEATSAERQQLAAIVRDDPEARALYEVYRELDLSAADALRRAMEPPRIVRLRPAWQRVAKGLLVTAAAAAAFVMWMRPQQPAPNPPRNGAQQAAVVAPSWFATKAGARDVLEPVPASFERPDVRVRGTHREWIVIPGEQPGTYFIIEVDRVNTRAIGIHRDY